MIEWINGYVLGAAVPLLLVVMGGYFGFRLKWFYLLHPVRTVRRALGGNVRGALSSLCLALAGTLGVGNIVGVAAAIGMGGVGAVFWMWVSAFFAMILKYAETVLAMRHRRRNSMGEWGGAAMYYIEDCIGCGKSAVGRWVATVFALLLTVNALSMGGALQAEAVTSAFGTAFGIPKPVTAVFLFGAVMIVTKGGYRRITLLTDRLVPFMSLAFFVVSVVAVALRADRLPGAFSAIFADAWNFRAGACGVFGFVLSKGVRYGTMRGLISNEAGCGTSPMAHSSSGGHASDAEGIWGIFEVLVDTVILCTLTALVITVSGVYVAEDDFMGITVRAYSSILGGWSESFMAVSVLMFGFATILCWSHYGRLGATYVFGEKGGAFAFFLLYGIAVLSSGFGSSELAWQAADLSVGAMTVINLSVLFVMRKEIVDESGFLLGSP